MKLERKKKQENDEKNIRKKNKQKLAGNKNMI